MVRSQLNGIHDFGPSQRVDNGAEEHRVDHLGHRLDSAIGTPVFVVSRPLPFACSVFCDRCQRHPDWMVFERSIHRPSTSNAISGDVVRTGRNLRFRVAIGPDFCCSRDLRCPYPVAMDHGRTDGTGFHDHSISETDRLAAAPTVHVPFGVWRPGLCLPLLDARTETENDRRRTTS